MMYSIIVSWHDYGLIVNDIKINNDSLPGFQNDIFNYTYKNLLYTDEITVDCADPETYIKITKPKNMIGDLLIEVTDYYGNSKTYVINLTFNKEIKLISLNSAATADGYVVEKNLQTGDSLWSDRAWETIDNFGDTPLSGIDYIKTANLDWNNQTNRNATIVDWISFKINNSADIYLFCNYQSSAYVIPWVESEGFSLLKDESGNSITFATNLSTFYIYKKTLEVEPGMTKTVTLKNLGPYGNLMYGIGIDWKDEETANLTIRVGENGNSDLNGIVPVVKGQTATIKVQPDQGYEIEYIKLNGMPVVAYQNSEFDYQTPAISSDALIEIAFAPIVEEPFVHGYPVPFAQSIGESPFGICFATAREKIGKYHLQEFGMLFSNSNLTKDEFVIENNKVRKASGERSNILGQYGIKFIGNAIKKSNTYYTRAYAIYSYNEEQIIVYNEEIINFNL